jgi:hypothetical protein
LLPPGAAGDAGASNGWVEENDPGGEASEAMDGGGGLKKGVYEHTRAFTCMYIHVYICIYICVCRQT